MSDIWNCPYCGEPVASTTGGWRCLSCGGLTDVNGVFRPSVNMAEDTGTRAHLFRGKTFDFKKWVCGNLVHSTLFYGDKRDAYCIVQVGEFYCDNYVHRRVDPATIGMYSDVPDKNGTLICEGDRLCVTRPCVLAYGSVSYKNGCFWFTDEYTGSMLRLCDAKVNGFEMEIIGTVLDKERQ